jgi:hypothetical protein
MDKCVPAFLDFGPRSDLALYSGSPGSLSQRDLMSNATRGAALAA